MHIALLNMQQQSKGGLEKFSIRFRKHLEMRGCTVSALHGNSLLLPKTRLRKKRAFDQACLRFTEKYPDAVFCLEKIAFPYHSVKNSPIYLRLGEGLHTSYLQQRFTYSPFWKRQLLHYSRFHQGLLSIEKTAFMHPQLKRIFCNSSMVRKELLATYQESCTIDPSSVSVIPNGVEWQEWEKPFSLWPEEKPKLLKKYGLKEGFHFLFVGSGWERKGLKPLLQAMTLLPKDAYLSVVGKDKRMRSFIRYAKTLGLEKQVHFFGSQPALFFYQYADCLVIPSYYDPFANVTLEGLAMGLQVLSSKHNGGSEILPDSAVFNSIYDIDAVADGLKKALLFPKSWKSSQSQRALAKPYDYPIMLEKMAGYLV